jgi:penicillin-insensitive murein endopeptidase
MTKLQVLLPPLMTLVLTGCLGNPSPLAPQLAGSVGMPQQGVLTDGELLPVRGDGFARYRPHDDTHWGVPRLVALIVEAAATVSSQMPGGAPLIVGDLSARRGGRIPRHNSHRSGRDVDLLWYLTTPQGVSVSNPGFVHLGPDGLAAIEGGGGYLALDLRRQWLLLKTLLTSKQASVQWAFVSKPIEALLIEYARARGEPDELIWQAESVLLQPSDSTEHDDHLHLRIACSPQEALTGCLGGGPRWQWLPELPALAPLSELDLTELGRSDPL